MKIKYFGILFLALFVSSLKASIISSDVVKFGNIQSSFTLKTGGTLDIMSKTFTVTGGQIDRTENGHIIGNPFYFYRGNMTSFLSTSYMSGQYHPDLTDIPQVLPYIDPNETIYSILVLGDNVPTNDIDFILANPGGLRHKLFITAPYTDGAILRGQPLFFGANDIILEDASTLLAIGIQNVLETNIVLNGGFLELQDNLHLGSSATLTASWPTVGSVVGNGRGMSIGGPNCVWTGQTVFADVDLALNSQVTISPDGAMLFYGDNQIDGNGNPIILQGALEVVASSTLRLSGVKIKGLGVGAFGMGPHSSLYLSDVEIEMDDNFTFNSGDVYVIGNSNVIVKDYLLTFASGDNTKGTLNVEGVALTYDPLDFVDQLNIQPNRINDPASEYVRIIDNGSIRLVRIQSISFTSYGSDTSMARYAIIYPDHKMTIFPQVINGQPQYDFTVDGQTQFLGFSAATEPLLLVSDGVHVIYENVFFRDFDPVHLSLGSGSSFAFGDNSSIRLWQDTTLSYSIVFKKRETLDSAYMMLRGGGAVMNLDNGGEIVLQGDNATLLIEGMTLKGVHGNKIRCESNTSKIIFQNTTLVQDGDFNFNTGSLEILNDVVFMGNGFKFNFTSNQGIVVDTNAIMQFMWGITFNYAPANKSLKLLKLTDATSALSFDNANLSAPNGIQLTKGRLLIKGACYSYNQNGTSNAEAIIFGDGNPKDNLLFDRSSMFIQQSGRFVDKTVSTASSSKQKKRQPL